MTRGMRRKLSDGEMIHASGNNTVDAGMPEMRGRSRGVLRMSAWKFPVCRMYVCTV